MHHQNWFHRDLWKDEYLLSWCDQCHVAAIKCPICQNSSCNGSSCDKCHAAFAEFRHAKITVETYLTSDEQKMYDKCLRLKHLMMSSLKLGHTSINWAELQAQGHLSQNDEEVFSKELKKQSRW